MITANDSLPSLFTLLKQEWTLAAKDKSHPFRYVVLTTLGDTVMSRYVVLRAFEADLSMLIYTDYRSRKVAHIQANDQVQLLFYDADRGLQVMAEAKAEVHHQNAVAKAHWNKVHGNGKRAYTTRLAPGEAISTPEAGHQWLEGLPDDHFTVLQIRPTHIELLQLNGSEHLRASFNLQNDWQGQWLVP